MAPPIHFPYFPSGGMARIRARAASLLAALAAVAFQATAAEIHPYELAMLQQQVQRTGWVRVMVTLDRSAWRTRSEEQTLRLQALADRLYAELGDSAFPTGRRNNGLGWIGFYTDSAGIAMLSRTALAEKFSIDPTGRSWGRERAGDGSFEAIDDALVASPTVEVDLVLATEEPPYTLLPDGSTRFDGPSEVNEVLDRLLTEPFAQHIKGIDRRQNPQLAPVVPAKIDRVAFFGLVESVHVRAVRPRGFVRQPSAIWHEDALRVATREGRAEIHILLRGGVTYTHLPHQSPKARRYQMDANTRALDEILKAAGVEALPVLSEVDAHMGLVYLFITRPQLEKLFAQRDPRILSVDVNKAIGGLASNN